MKLHPLIENAYKVLDGDRLDRDEVLALANGIFGTDILDLISLANKVRCAFAPEDAISCSIVNAKCGKCGEKCAVKCECKGCGEKCAVKCECKCCCQTAVKQECKDRCKKAAKHNCKKCEKKRAAKQECQDCPPKAPAPKN